MTTCFSAFASFFIQSPVATLVAPTIMPYNIVYHKIDAPLHDALSYSYPKCTAQYRNRTSKEWTRDTPLPWLKPQTPPTLPGLQAHPVEYLIGPCEGV